MKVYLTGGLGNQLFQLAAALENSQGRIELISDIGNPRLDKSDIPEIFSFDLPDQVSAIPAPLKFRKTTTKVIGLNLRSHFNPRSYEKKCLWIYRSLGNVYLSLIFKEILQLRVGRNIGFTPIRKLRGRDLLAGYFQSFKYLDGSTLENFLALDLLEPSQEYLEYLAKLQGQRILVTHVRLGDYLVEPTIGVLSREYYERAFREIDLNNIDRVLVFSDSPNLVSAYLPKGLSTEFEVVPNSFSSAETLMLMRTGNEFIISNSTFSWWGAMLSQNRDAKVIAPTPWFVAQEEPKALLPSSWIKVKRKYSSFN